MRRRAHLTSIRDINMTPLIDLTFLLLIVFMITVPLLEYSVDISPPELKAEPMVNKESITVNLNSGGKIILDKNILSRDLLIKRLRQLNKASVSVFLRADGRRPYNEVIFLMKAIKTAGIRNISLITLDEKK